MAHMQAWQSMMDLRDSNVVSSQSKSETALFKVPTVFKKKRKLDTLIPDHVKKKLAAAPLETPEQIDAFIAERKKNYPTQKNIEKRKHELDTKLERGDILAQERVHDPKLGTQKPKPKPKPQPKPKPKPQPILGLGRRQPDNNRKRSTNNQQSHRKDTRKGGFTIPLPSHSLLRKLLDNEVSQEYSLILQCFRYMVKTDFFSSIDNASHASIDNASVDNTSSR